jgi:hypothetical protein
MAQDIRDAKFKALRRCDQYRKILETDEIRKAQFQEHSTDYQGRTTRDFLRRQAFWYDRHKCPNGLRYDGDGGLELDSESWEAYYLQEIIPGIVPKRMNTNQLKTEKGLEDFRARRAMATASRSPTVSQEVVAATQTPHAMLDEDVFRNINELIVEDDLIENELGLTCGRPIGYSIDPNLVSVLSAPSNEPSNDTPTDALLPLRKGGRGSDDKRTTAKQKGQTAEAAEGQQEMERMQRI